MQTGPGYSFARGRGLVSRLPGHSKVISLAGTEARHFDIWQERFLKEAQTLAQFEYHPNIVSVRDFFKANDTAYMIMSYVEGFILKAGYAPEGQYRSRGSQGPWTDVYAVGATIYSLITGETSPESMERLVEDTIAPPSMLGVEIDPEGEEALLKTLAARAKDRYQTVEEFQSDLSAVLAVEKSRPVESYEPVIAGENAPEFKAAEASPSPERIKAPPGKKWLPIGAGIVALGAIFFLVYVYLIVPPVKTITLSNSAISMEAGQDEIALEATVEPSLAFRTNLIWSSSNPRVALVSDEDLATALDVGSAEIKVQAENSAVAETVVVAVTLPTIDWDGGTYTGLLKDGRPHW